MIHQMPNPTALEKLGPIKAALARSAYERNAVRIAQPDLRGYPWLVATARGVFAVSLTRAMTVLHGWYFGICRHHDRLYIFENCGRRDRSVDLGRIVRIDLTGGRLANPAVVVTGLHGNCHQVRVISEVLCVVDTANQAIRRYTLDGEPIDVKYPFPPAPHTDRTGRYLHINSIAQFGSHIALMLHNGKALPERSSELALLDTEWRLVSRQPLDGRWCHDIVADEQGVVWHCGTEAGELLRSDGPNVKITDNYLTRGLAVSGDQIVVGISAFGPRSQRDKLAGSVVILNRAFERLAELTLEGPPADIAALQLED